MRHLLVITILLWVGIAHSYDTCELKKGTSGFDCVTPDSNIAFSVSNRCILEVDAVYRGSLNQSVNTKCDSIIFMKILNKHHREVIAIATQDKTGITFAQIPDSKNGFIIMSEWLQIIAEVITLDTFRGT
jgi:hypothetical protein